MLDSQRPTAMREATEERARGADLVLHNANVLTFAARQLHQEPQHQQHQQQQQPQSPAPQRPPSAEVVAIRGDRILALGAERDLDQLRRAGVELVDCGGGTVIPGFNDAHCHPIALAISRLAVDCSPGAVKSIAEIQDGIRRRAEQTAETRWIRAAGYDETRLAERRAPTRWELDQAAPRHPVVLVHATGQSCVLNSAALRLAGVTGGGPGSRECGIARDPRTGEPTGLVAGRQDHIARAIPPLDAEEIQRGMALANREYLSQGITSLQDASWTNGWRQWELWQRLVSRGVVAPRVSMLAGTESLDRFRSAGLSTGSGDERLRLGALKLALDESTGCSHPPQDDVNELALRAHEAGFQVAFHVSDVRMLEASLAAIAFVGERSAGQAPAFAAGRDARQAPAFRLARGRGPRQAPAFRLEHCAVCPPRLLPRVKASGAIVVTQPSFLRGFGGKYLEDASPHQVDWFCPIGSFRRLGIEVAFGSDSPLVTADPLIGIQAAVTRRTEAGRSLGARECVTALDALEMYTVMGPRASLEAEVKGSIGPGKLADLVVLSRDPTEIPPEELSTVEVERTIIGGKVVWEA